LGNDLRQLRARAQQAEGTIRVTIAANANVNDDTRDKTILRIHPIADNWEFMSLLSSEIFNAFSEFRRVVDDHNFDMMRAGGAFGADNFRQSILQRIQLIQAQSAQVSNLLVGAIQE